MTDGQRGPHRVVRLRRGHLHADSCLLVAEVERSAQRLFPRAGLSVSGMSSLRFLLDPARATVAEARQALGGDAGPAEVEEFVVVSSSLRLDTVESVQESLSWRDGPAEGEVGEALTAAVGCRWQGPRGAGTVGLAEPLQAGSVYPVHHLQRNYSARAFTLYALAQHPLARVQLAELGFTDLPGAALGPVEFATGRSWLSGLDLSWDRWPAGALRVLDVVIALLPSYFEGTPDVADVLAAADDGRLLAAIGAAAERATA